MEKTKPDFNPIRLLILGVCASGKTTLLKQILDKSLRGKFDTIHLLCPTHKSQDIYNKIKGIEKYEDATNSQFMEIWEKCKDDRKENKESLIILDDWINGDLSRSNSVLNKIIPVMRHEWTSIVIISQAYNSSLPPVVRNNMNQVICFHNNSRKQVGILRDDYGDKWYEHYKKFTSKPYGYVYSDLEKNELSDERYKDSYWTVANTN